MIEANTAQIKRYEADLKTFAAKAFPVATRSTLNKGAFSGRKIAINHVAGKMIERNSFTRNSVRVDKASGTDVSRQEARLGSIAAYMAGQEFGETLQAKGKHGRPIPTPASSGEQSLPRRKLPRKPNKFSNIALSRKAAAGANRRARNRIAVMEAAAGKGGSKFVFLDLGRRAGIYRVSGGKRRPKLRKIYDLSRRTVVVPQRKWLKPATDITAKQMPRYYGQELQKQLRKARVLGYR